MELGALLCWVFCSCWKGHWQAAANHGIDRRAGKKGSLVAGLDGLPANLSSL